MRKNNVIPQMFDIRPVDETGNLDWKKIRLIGNPVRVATTKNQTFAQSEEERMKRIEMERRKKEIENCKKAERLRALQEKRDRFIMTEQIRRREEDEAFIREEKLRSELKLKEILECNKQKQKAHEEAVGAGGIAREDAWIEQETSEKSDVENIKNYWQKNFAQKCREKSDYGGTMEFSLMDLILSHRFTFGCRLFAKPVQLFVFTALLVSLGIGGVSYASKGLDAKGKVLGVSQSGFENLASAINDLSNRNFENSSKRFAEAHEKFSNGSEILEGIGGSILDVARFVPYATKVSSGRNAVEAGKHLSLAGGYMNEVAHTFSEIENLVGKFGDDGFSFLDILKMTEKNISLAKAELDAAQNNIDKIVITDLPEDKRDEFFLLKENMPDIRKSLDFFLANSHILTDLLGGNGPRKYLFLFQNNSEMRATGGFIGSYGLLDISNGRVKNFFIDGIYNPDGQLKEKIVPPQPIQKISAAWSLHDSNWFADFPMSAKKAITFYEKTGGPTVDGVVTFTPALIKKMLAITGPIEMPEYEVTLDENNFTEVTQYEVEVDYDKEENEPKKILADLAPILLQKLLDKKDIESISKIVQVLLLGLDEKHILIYSSNPELQRIVSQQGWSGEILPSSCDYLSVINTNINGFKTDAVVEEKIEHGAEIQEDGSIVDTVTITRRHTGGNSEYEWFNKVNADYMRVYVPEGAKLLEASGHTREAHKQPLDYDALNFKRDADVEREERDMIIDPESGTRIYNEAGKTVFANWVYISPQEEVSVTYKYILPVRMFQVSIDGSNPVDSYSLVFQKQSGSYGSLLESRIQYPSSYEIKWSFPENMEKGSDGVRINTDLSLDRFAGVVFEKKQ
ncbi:MAG TPA: DUF4012 domain-containing protein [Candidatus Moranbacteria bacterium]|jgi:hypothetical protein|nr:DUF4012 domain-containing protein [Candidatus Moranbacteria bacterium]